MALARNHRRTPDRARLWHERGDRAPGPARSRPVPIELRSVTLCNGSVHVDLAHLTPSQRLLKSPALGPLFARFASKRIFVAQLRRILGDARTVSAADLDAMWEGLQRDGGASRLPSISAYLDERVRFRSRWIGALTSLDLPAHILWGRRNPVAVPAIAEALASEIPEPS